MKGAHRFLGGAALALSAPSVLTLTSAVAVAAGSSGGLSPGMVDEFFEPGQLRVFRPAPPTVLKSWGPGEKPLQPLNALGARIATLALRFGLARLLEIHPRTDEGRRWGVAVKRTKAERQQAALQAMREDAMIARTIREQDDFRRSLRIQDPPASLDELSIPLITKPTETP